jgi:hypothetical protein
MPNTADASRINHRAHVFVARFFCLLFFSFFDYLP